MPEMDGFELIEHLRHTPEIQNVKIIVSSASVFETDQHRSLQAGGNAFLSKPIQVDELLHQLEQYLNLVWIYKQFQPHGEKAKEATTANSEPAQLTFPSPQILQELVTLASKGNFTAILKWADQLEETDRKFVPFANELRQLARQFDEDLILNLLTQYAVETV